MEKWPEGGKLAKWIFGSCLPLLLIIPTAKALLAGKVLFLGKGRLFLEGDAAIAMGIGYLAVALFAHFHWFWGLSPRLRDFSYAGKIAAIVVFCAGYGYAVLSVFRRVLH
jgi:hypothetical protein